MEDNILKHFIVADSILGHSKYKMNSSFKKPFNCKNRWLFIAGVLVITFGAPFIFNEYSNNLFSKQSMMGLLGSLSTTLIMWLGVRSIVVFLWKNYPWEKNPIWHIIIEVLSILFYTFLVGGTFYLIHEYYPIQNFEENMRLSVFFTLMITFFITSIYEGYFFFEKWKETRVLSEKLARENIQSQYETLKSQINPHFLFNNLNTLTTLIEEDPKAAVEYVQKTADYYRHILNLKDREVITLAEELELIRTFYDLQRNRYGENFRLDIDIPGHLYQTVVAPLALQMLVENAIKHNIISREKPLTVRIDSNHSYIRVSNNLQRRELDQPSSQFGLKNIADRYSFFSNRGIDISENDSNFTVSIPILTL